jgi:hypothetical protein
MALLQGVDYSFDHPTPSELAAAGMHFACRYVYPHSQQGGTKNLTKAEATALWAKHIDICSNFESWAARGDDGFAAGQADARAGARQHAECGGPAHAPIFFSVDFDTTASNYPGVDSYFRGAASVLGLARVGAYGEYDLMKHLIDKGLVGRSHTAGKFYAWQTYAWSGGQYDERCAVAQDKNGQRLGSGTVDYDSAHAADYGQWHYTAPTTPTPPKPPADAWHGTRDEIIDLIQQGLQATLRGGDHPPFTHTDNPAMVFDRNHGVLDRLHRLENP